jgi:hypothetical protein
MVDTKTLSIVGIIAIVLLVLYLLLKKYKAERKKQKLAPIFNKKIKNGKKPEQHSGEIIPLPDTGTSYTYSVWLNVNDWDYRRNSYKHVFHKGDRFGNNCQPGVWITPGKNNLIIRVATKGGATQYELRNGAPDYITDIMSLTDRGKLENDNYKIVKNKASARENTLPKTYKEIKKEFSYADQIILISKNKLFNDNSVPEIFVVVKNKDLIQTSQARLLPSKKVPGNSKMVFNYFTADTKGADIELNPEMSGNDMEGSGCVVENFPLKRWFHLVIVTFDRNFDVYIDGKLYRSIPLLGEISENSGDLFVNQGGGFGGQISQLRYFNRALSLKDVSFFYKCGPLCPVLPDLPDLDAWAASMKPKLKIKFDVKIDVGADTEVGKEKFLNYNLEDMKRDTSKNVVSFARV